MSRFDLSNAADFSRLTQQSAVDINALFGGKDPHEWNIVEASYNGVVFHVFVSNTNYEGAVGQVTDSGGRRKVKYQFPYRDGQTTDDLGRKPESFELEIVLFGQNYMDGFNSLMVEFNKPTPGILVHPVRGNIPCVVEDFKFAHSHDKRKSVTITATFIEHTYTVGKIEDLNTVKNTIKAALSAGLDIFKKVDAAINKVEGAQLLIRGVKNRINSFLAIYKTNNAKTLTRANQTFNTKGGSSDIPSLLPVSQGGTRNPDGSVSSNNFVTATSVTDPFNSVPISEINVSTVAAIAAVSIEKEVIALRQDLTVILNAIIDNGGALELYDTIVDLRLTAVLMQQVLEAGIASSNAQLKQYTVPILMSIREVAFANGLDVNRIKEIDLLNPSLLSTNFIEKGTILQVPSA